MKILFLTYGNICDIYDHSIYSDLLRCFISGGNDVYTVSPKYEEIDDICEDGLQQIFLDFDIGRAGNNFIKKGISTVLTDRVYLRGIKQHFHGVRFDMVIYTTPPITFTSTVKYIKNRDKAETYLILKDIFPQNAVDIGIMSKVGVKGLIYKHFRRQERKLYMVSDHIGCMSLANVDYVIKHNQEIDPRKVEVCPNSITAIDKSVDSITSIKIREKYGIPINKTIFIYGGNLGKPQGIPFIIECLRKCDSIGDAFFLVVGNGTDYGVLEEYVNKEKPNNVKLMSRLPKEDYDTLVAACDVGLIFLDHRFTIPNFPSRILVYMQAKLPILAATDPNTDIGKVIVDGGFGWWCESNDSDQFVRLVSSIINQKHEEYGTRGLQYLLDHYSAQKSYEIIVRDRG